MTTFKKGDIVRHHKDPTHDYKVVMIPAENLFIEATSQPAYAYTSLRELTTWVRPAAEMEDGRFTLVKSDSTQKQHWDPINDD